MSRQPPSAPTTTVVVVVYFSAVATNTPGAISSTGPAWVRLHADAGEHVALSGDARRQQVEPAEEGGQVGLGRGGRPDRVGQPAGVPRADGRHQVAARRQRLDEDADDGAGG